jgi:phosphate uptake regulator
MRHVTLSIQDIRRIAAHFVEMAATADNTPRISSRTGLPRPNERDRLLRKAKQESDTADSFELMLSQGVDHYITDDYFGAIRTKVVP